MDTYRGSRAARLVVSYQLRTWPSKRSSPSSVENVRSSRSTMSEVRTNPKSCAASVDSKPSPMLVGEVRRASMGPGYSWKLSGGRWWLSAFTNVSK